MPTTKSVEFAKFDNASLKSRPDSIQAEGRVRYLNDIIDTTAANGAADVITLLPLPAGALVDRRRSFIYVEIKPAATVTCDIGMTSDPDGFCDGTDLAVVGKFDFAAGTGALGADLVEVLPDDPIILTLNTMTTPQIGRIRVSIAYYVR
jgi:hypothetical protein